MLGKNQGWVTTQGEILTRLFGEAGYPVRMTSTIPRRIPRMLDILRSLWLWRDEIDVVVLAVFSGPGFIAGDLASRFTRLLGKPLISVLRGGRLPEYAASRKGYVDGLLRRSNLVISPSDYLAHFFRAWGHPVEVIPNVLDIESYPYRCREEALPRLLWMRTFHNIYHPEMAVEVLEQLVPRLPGVSLTMAGQEKGLLKTTQELAARKGLDEQVRFAGFLDLPAKQREFAAHDIYLHTNRVDNMPVSVVEAAAFGLPVVATRVGGIPYLLEDGKNALIVESGDAKGMAEAVIRLVEEPGLASLLSQNGRQLAEMCAWENVRQQWDAAFGRILNHAKTA
jgi:glycosyltransferase involved in cell wall biosynthesis